MQAQFLECVILKAFAVGIASYSMCELSQFHCQINHLGIPLKCDEKTGALCAGHTSLISFQTKRNGTLFGRMQQNNIKNLNIAVNSFISGRRDQALVEFTLFILPQTYKPLKEIRICLNNKFWESKELKRKNEEKMCNEK
ncbi:hypothetical protein EGR_07561 [Echinococcus granulosus]|uniref:Uncharacterized protein n=1 Tax=Echinococcus granulosus TaxID=6210 RepID=W6U968_ECHGR|nr:hypothetical protein EGR_07561 [Echinococcus granulosus]EUB57550.1 hypothetical protein EGR_07561 [Echinococcus granulosus]